MNTVWNSYGQLLRLPEKTSKRCKFFCRGLDIRVAKVMKAALDALSLAQSYKGICNGVRHNGTDALRIGSVCVEPVNQIWRNGNGPCSGAILFLV